MNHSDRSLGVSQAPHPGSAPLRWLAIAALAMTIGAGCGSDTSAGGSSAEFGGVNLPPGSGGSAGFVAPGAADFAVFRAIVSKGEVPASNVLDDLGFFAEHKIDFPQADCGQDLCLHGRVGIMGNLITGSTCSILQIGLNSPIDPSKLARPPLHLVLVLDASGGTEREQLGRFIPWLATVSSVSPLIGLFGTVLGVISAFQGVVASGSSNLTAVAPGIAQALTATAAALAVAIPAAFAYNVLAARLNRYDGALEGFGSELVALMVREGRI